MTTILVTNDDGVRTPGLLALVNALDVLGDVIVLAPEHNWSASGHSKTMHQSLRVHPVELADGRSAHMCSGTPTDCVALAAGGILGVVPDLVVSGINAGYNLGIDITYSGTVAGAMEATIKGIPGIAVSTSAVFDKEIDTTELLVKAADYACTIAERVIAEGLPANTLLNVNVPGIEPKQIRRIEVTRMGQRQYAQNEVDPRRDPAGRSYYWLGGGAPIDTLDDGTDVAAISRGEVSVTPVSLDMTAHDLLADLSAWTFGSAAATPSVLGETVGQ